MRSRAMTTVSGALLVGFGAALLVISPAGAVATPEGGTAGVPVELPPGSTPTPTASATTGATPSATATATPAATVSAEPTGTVTPTAAATPTEAPTPSATATADPSATPDPSATATVDPSATPDPSATGAPTASPSPAASCPPGSTSSAVPSATAEPSATESAPSASASASPSGGGGLPIPTLAPRTEALPAPPEPARDPTSCRAATVSLAVNVPQITAGNTPTLSGVVRDGRGDALPDATVTIYAKAYAEEEYHAVATVRSDNAGQFRLQVRPTKQTAYGANVGDARSPVVVIFVYTRVNLTSPAPGRTVSNPVTFTGGLIPGYARVAVGLGYLVNGRFVVLTQANTNASGEYAVTGRLPRGTYAFVVFTSAHQGSDKGAKSVRLTVR